VEGSRRWPNRDIISAFLWKTEENNRTSSRVESVMAEIRTMTPEIKVYNTTWRPASLTIIVANEFYNFHISLTPYNIVHLARMGKAGIRMN
jgi:hypothetical protein